MNDWHIFARDLSDTLLADELSLWIPKQKQDLYLFREGATVCDLSWAGADSIVYEQLKRVWMIRVFCRHFELCARRRTYDGDGNWQLRIIGPASDLPDGQPVTPVGDPIAVMLLGERSGDGAFVDKPNRYRRARMHYPISGDLSSDATCRLLVKRFHLGGTDESLQLNGAFSCWTGIEVENPATTGSSKNQRHTGSQP